MTTSKFEELEIYQLAEKLSDRVWDIVILWDSFPRWTIGTQIVKASDSVGANIAEGYGRESKADRARFTKISRGSLFETKHWVKKSYRRKLLSDVEFSELTELVELILPKISAYINYLKAGAKKSK